ncbi:MAG: HAD family hydrolase [Deltaproteobacteria bacterium]|nr:HAD family hydrolase [Deltaproteobacteria bacterium]
MTGQAPKAVTTVIYDCDGVMFESFEANFAFYSKVLEHFGKSSLDRCDAGTMRLLHTYSSRDVLARLFAGDPREEEALRFAASIDYRELLPYMHMEEGLLDTLEALRGRVNLAVCTNRSTSVEMLLQDFGLSSYFSFVMTALKVANPKPHPEPLLKILDYYRIDPMEALFVGDSELDRRSADAAGVPFVAYKADLPCLARIDHHPDILKLI